MRKEISICFRTTENLRGLLKTIAVAERRSISSLIETIVYDFLKDQKKLAIDKDERRSHSRKKVFFPSLVRKDVQNGSKLHAGVVIDLSPGGLQLSVPRGSNFEVQEAGKPSGFEVFFTLPNSNKPLQMNCNPCWVDKAKDEMKIGASFADSDYSKLNLIHNYLLQ